MNGRVTFHAYGASRPTHSIFAKENLLFCFLSVVRPCSFSYISILYTVLKCIFCHKQRLYYYYSMLIYVYCYRSRNAMYLYNSQKAKNRYPYPYNIIINLMIYILIYCIIILISDMKIYQHIQCSLIRNPMIQIRFQIHINRRMGME